MFFCFYFLLNASFLRNLVSRRAATPTPHSFFLKYKLCELQKCFSPLLPHSLPMPLCLWPPNGTSGDTSICALTQTLPASSCRAMRAASSRSDDQTEAPSPICVLLARAITSSSSVQERIGMMGPGFWLAWGGTCLFAWTRISEILRWG